MIHPIDIFTLAHTKLRTRKIRTGFTVLISGLLFGLLLAVLITSAGVMQSVNEFGKEGIGEKYIVKTEPTNPPEFDIFTLQSDANFIARVEQLHKERIAAKKSEAARLKITYDPSAEDPSPIIIDKANGNTKSLNIDLQDSSAVQQALKEHQQTTTKPMKASDYTKGFSVKRQLTELTITPDNATLIPMTDGKEDAITNYGKKIEQLSYTDYLSAFQSLAIEDDTLSMPYVTKKIDPTKATAIPIVITYTYAEKALGFKKLPTKATPAERIERIRTVREKAVTMSIDFCYRNNASSSLLSRALDQQKEIAKNKDNKLYTQPTVAYQVPDEKSCGPVLIARDSRSNTERTQDQAREEFARKFDNATDPIEHKLRFQVIGISPSASLEDTQSLVSGVSMMLAANSVPHWQIPAGYFSKLPAELKPEVVFGTAANATDITTLPPDTTRGFVTEFSSLETAQNYVNKYACDNSCASSIAYAHPYANNTLMMRDIKQYIDTIILWVTLALSFVAIIILGSMIGRTVADGRRETAVFRSIGAKRIDIVSIYTCYTLLLSLRIIIFVALLGTILAAAADYWFSPQITPEALIAFSAQDLNRQFHLFGISSPYLLYLPLVIVGISLLAMIPPMLLGVRRNPIKDMRQE